MLQTVLFIPLLFPALSFALKLLHTFAEAVNSADTPILNIIIAENFFIFNLNVFSEKIDKSGDRKEPQYKA